MNIHISRNNSNDGKNKLTATRSAAQQRAAQRSTSLRQQRAAQRSAAYV